MRRAVRAQIMVPEGREYGHRGDLQQVHVVDVPLAPCHLGEVAEGVPAICAPADVQHPCIALEAGECGEDRAISELCESGVRAAGVRAKETLVVVDNARASEAGPWGWRAAGPGTGVVVVALALALTSMVI
jgi:hypothetical protein